MLTHYLELLRHFWKSIVLGSLLAGTVALVFSLILLRAMPVYQSSVTLNMQPSVEDLQFNSGFLGVSQFNPATIIAQTHIERLLSRPVANRAIDILVENSGGGLPSDPPTAFDRFRAGLWKWYNILNFGYFTPLPERQVYVNDLINATEVEIVEGSYILLVSVSHSDPQVAADAANALAEAYIIQAQVDFSEDAAEVDRTLEVVQTRAEGDLAELVTRRRDIARQLGITSLSAERTELLDSRSAARLALQEAELDIAQLRTQVEGLAGSAGREGDADIARQLRQTLVEVRASISAAETRRTLREENLRRAEQALRDLAVAEDSFLELDQKIKEAETDLAELQERRVQIELAREARLSQVRTISDARVPVYPRFPKVLVNTIVGLILGGILVLVPVSAMDILGDRVRTTEDLRGSFGTRVLPAVSPRLLRQARKYRKRGRMPGAALRRFADIVGRRLSSEGPRRWPDSTLYVTAMGSDADTAKLATVMRAVVAFLEREGPDGTPLKVKALPTLSRLSDWTKHSGDHVVIGLHAGEALRDELDSIAGHGSEMSPTFATILT